MRPKEAIEDRLRAAVGRKLDTDLLRDTLLSIDSLRECMDALLKLQRVESDWRIPLSDGIRVEVRIYGPATTEHVKAFAQLFQSIADNYVAPKAAPPGPEAHAGRNLSSSTNNSKD